MPFSCSKVFHGFLKSQIFYPVLFFIFFITDLIHNVKSISAFRINRLKQAYRILDGIQRIDNGFFIYSDLFGDFCNGRLLQILFHIIFFGIDSLVGNITKGTADPDAVVITKISADFPYDHRHCISGEFYLQGGVKVVNGFDQTNAANLKKVIRIFVAVLESADHTEYKAQVAFDVTLSGSSIPILDPMKKLFFFF